MAHHTNTRDRSKKQFRKKQAPDGHTGHPVAAPVNGDTLPARARPGAMPVLLGILALGFLFRFLHLSDLSLWVDEYVHVLRAKNFLEGTGPLLTDDNNGILLTMCLLPGFAAFGPQVFWARFPSVLFGVGLIWLVYRAGERWFNRYVGLFAASGAAFSLYLVFWSRMCRNYSILAFFYLLLGLVFLAAVEAKPAPDGPRWWQRAGFSPRHLAALPAAGVLALLAHQLAFFFVFTVLAYAMIRFVQARLAGADKPVRAKYMWGSAVLLPLVPVIGVPAVGEQIKESLQPFLLSNIAEWAIPDWNRLAGWWAEKPFEAFQVYHGLMRYDLNALYVPAIAGMAAAFWLSPRAGAWLLSSFAIPFLLLSFVFREPVLNRYLIFVYPYLFISAGVFFYAAWTWARQKFWPAAPAWAARVALALPFVLLLGNTRWTALADLALGRKQDGHVVDMRIATWPFTGWKDACAFVGKKSRAGDVMMSTVPAAAAYYLQRDNVLWFRQAYYDIVEKQYKLNTPNPSGGPSAASFDDLVRTVQASPRGWLLADYYLENIFTDERAALWVYQNMHYYPEASPDGSVMVFGWDHAQAPPERQNMVVELGRDDDKTESKEYHLNLPEQLFSLNQIELTLRTRWVDSNREGLVLFNGQNAMWLLPNTGPGIEEYTMPLQRDWIRPGRNTVQILYETKRPSDPRKGFTLYYLSVAGK